MLRDLYPEEACAKRSKSIFLYELLSNEICRYRGKKIWSLKKKISSLIISRKKEFLELCLSGAAERWRRRRRPATDGDVEGSGLKARRDHRLHNRSDFSRAVTVRKRQRHWGRAAHRSLRKWQMRLRQRKYHTLCTENPSQSHWRWCSFITFIYRLMEGNISPTRSPSFPSGATGQ